MTKNFDVFDFKLSDEGMQTIRHLDLDESRFLITVIQVLKAILSDEYIENSDPDFINT